MKDSYETYVVEIGHQQGKRYARRTALKITLDHALGRLERLSDLQLREALQDLQVEQERRVAEAQHQAEVAAKCGGYDPFASQVRSST